LKVLYRNKEGAGFGFIAQANGGKFFLEGRQIGHGLLRIRKRANDVNGELLAHVHISSSQSGVAESLGVKSI
jgi:hypothetical protein